MIQGVLALLGIAGQSLASWQERKKIETDKKLEIHRLRAEAQIEAEKSRALAEAQYDNLAQRQMQFSWKDEYLTIVFTLPFLISFAAPFVALFSDVNIGPALQEAWYQVGLAPYWYQATVVGIIAATFGLRWFFKDRVAKMIEKQGD
jgi:Flp pilus assembly protein TadB